MSGKCEVTSKQCLKPCCSNCQSRIFILKEFEPAIGEEAASIVQLRHPRTETAALFVFSPGHKTVYELLTFNSAKPRSFFVGNKVLSDGRVCLSTPIDPLFLVLPYLRKYEKCSPLDHIITDEDFPEAEKLLECTGLKYIYQIADRKGEESLNAYAYNEEKTLKWLEKKVRRVGASIKNVGIHVGSNSVLSANFVVVKDSEEDEDSYLRYALGIVSNYLPDSVTSALESHMNLLPLESEKKRKTTPVENEQIKFSKKQKLEEDEGFRNDTTPIALKEKKATPSAKEKALAKAASGSKNIMAFFKKK